MDHNLEDSLNLDSAMGVSTHKLFLLSFTSFRYISSILFT